MAQKVLINLATGLEDPERVTVAFLVGGTAAQRAQQPTSRVLAGERRSDGTEARC